MDDQPDTYIDQTLAFGPFTLHRSRKLLLDGGRPVKLGGRAFDVLIALIDRAGEVVGKQQLVSCVWPNVLVEDSSLRVHVAALRKALGDGQDGVRYIANVPGRGYCFIAPIARLPTVRASSTENARNHNLPARLTRLVGREDSLRALAHGLPLRRFLTIVGPGGMGKTTLALALAELVASGYADGVCFVDLSILNDPSQVHVAVATALGIAVGKADPAETIVGHLRQKHLLVLLDNCERVVDAAASLATVILQGAPDVHVLATSREPLLAPGELVQRVQGLSTPEETDRITAGEALAHSSVRLFVERAIACVDTFELSDADAPVVAALCRQLDGMPLAIELAAAQIDAFGLLGLTRQLADRFAMLSAELRTQPARHRTLRAMLDWSFDMLQPNEQEVLKRLSVFRAGFTLEAAVAVAMDASLPSAKIVSAVGELAVKSLLVASSGDQGARYRLLDITRAYAFEMLGATEYRREIQRRHALYLRDLLDCAGKEQDVLPAREWVVTYGLTIDDVRTALDWANSPDGDVFLGIQLTAASLSLGYQLWLIDEIRGYLEHALANLRRLPTYEPVLEVRLMTGLNHLGSAHQGGVPLDATAPRLEFADHMLFDANRQQAIHGQWVDAFGRADYPGSLRHAEQLTRLARDSTDPMAMLVADRLRAQSLHFMGQHEEATRLAERVLNHPSKAMRLSMSIGTPLDRRVSMRIVLARILWLRAFPEHAQAMADEALRFAEADVSYSLSQAICYAALPIAISRGDWVRSEALSKRLSDHTRRTSHLHYSAWAANFETLLRCVATKDTATAITLHVESDYWQKDMFASLMPSFLTMDAVVRAEQGIAPWSAAAVLRSYGESIAVRASTNDDIERAGALFEKSAALASSQGALALELRALTSLVRLQAGRNRAWDALPRLMAAYGRCTEGFETTDLRTARATLEAVGA